MTEERKHIAIIIPALNEEGTIATVVQAVRPFGDVIVVDDGSTDKTAQIAQEAGAEVVSHPVNQGYDMALFSGFSRAIEAGYKICLSIDADNQHCPEFIPQLVKPIEDGKAAISIGVRPKPARLSEALFRLYTKARWGIGDILCGMKAYDTAVLKGYIHIFRHPTIGTGVTLTAARDGIEIAQLDMPVRERVDTPRIGRVLRANWIIFKAMLGDIFSGGNYARSG
ncbi:glycosyltransferase family 2 protein [Emcibacter nanhaiensis]|uniref:Glycosyltransferase family 2 protein n=1 Tax=Emcibacter nanhaiensis TaxID=1505037 RepID=A0A501PRX8_9PROT|nr:glycosyltransferase family 2 protein [Emcibacter nanhaiensis]TPD62822.1 glycosyltransferase family 2 protein [Emcibacter nanhaiensis]